MSLRSLSLMNGKMQCCLWGLTASNFQQQMTNYPLLHPGVWQNCFSNKKKKEKKKEKNASFDCEGGDILNICILSFSRSP